MERTWMPVVAGILSIVSGAFGFIGALIVGLVASVFLVTANYTGTPANIYCFSSSLGFFFNYISVL